jgi:hypothetical protein
MANDTQYTGTYVRDDAWTVKVSNTLDVPVGATVNYAGKEGKVTPMRCLYVKQRTKGVGGQPDSCLVYAQRIASPKGLESLTKAQLLELLAKAGGQASA